MAAPFPSRGASPRAAPGVGVARGQIELDITIGNIVSAGWARAAGKVTASTLDVHSLGPSELLQGWWGWGKPQ